MDNQKDTRKISSNSYGHTTAHDMKSLVNKPIYKYASKKTEKLVTALYMVTDCMETDDALKNKIRFESVELLSDMYKLSASSLLDNHTQIASTLVRIHEVISLVGVASTIGYISDMNAAILEKELHLLISELQPKENGGNPFAFSLDEKMFDVERTRPESSLGNHTLKDNSQRHLFIKDKRTDRISPPPFRGGVSVGRNGDFSLTTTPSPFLNKEGRVAKILGIIKDKKEVSIKDISITFTDYSEKTIQRELNSLVSKGQIKKVGAKRWSRYQAL